jgi:uncharacterized protein YndB with AHSA1/START domain
MSVLTKDDPPKRYVQVEVEVPGTPEQVWQAIATGPGFTAWFAPTEIEEREGGAVVFHMGPGMDSHEVITAWEPPHHFAAEDRDWMPGAPPCALEIHVEAKSGGTCVVRLVNSLYTSAADWDDQLESFEKGWPSFLEVLRVYLTHYPGQRCSPVQVTGAGEGPEARVWADFTAALGLAGAVVGERRTASGAGVPPLSGIVEQSEENMLRMRLDEPAPGSAVLGGCAWGGQVLVSVSLYLYGDEAPAVVDRDRAAWQAWMDGHFPAPVAAEAPAGAATG